MYIVTLDPYARKVVVNPRELPETRTVSLREINWTGGCDLANASVREISVRIRSTRPPRETTLRLLSETEAEVELLTAVESGSPGHACKYLARARISADVDSAPPLGETAGLGRRRGMADGSGGRGRRELNTKVKTARGRKLSSARWLERQLNDPYVSRARAEGYRCRAAYKILELDDRFGFLSPGAKVLDLGCAPGGWCQVVAERVNA